MHDQKQAIELVFEGTRYGPSTVAELLVAGVPQAAIDASFAMARAKLIKAECRRRIYSAASSETQMNFAASAAVISAKTASARSAGEKAVLTGLTEAIQWIADTRTAAGILALDADADFLADAAWPGVPENVTAIAAQF